VEELSEQNAEDLWSRSLNFLDGERSRSWHEFQVHQPALYHYIVDRSESRFEPEVAELLEQTASLIWRLFFSVDDELERIMAANIEDLERSNASVLQLLSDESSLHSNFEDRFDMLMEHSSDLPQRHLFRLTFEHLDTAHSDRNPELDDFNFALLMFYLRVFIDCLDQA
tara:strand:- start:1191 stop:1697 length:507 start_codon:yes stop_codon:yes gene_type:complete